MRSLTWLARLGLVVVAGALLTTAVAVGIVPRIWQAANAHEEDAIELPPFQPLAQRSRVFDRNGKEIAIFRAHKATPIVIADDGDARYPAAAVIGVPPIDPALGFVLSAMAGHLFGYEAALAIDASALP